MGAGANASGAVPAELALGVARPLLGRRSAAPVVANGRVAGLLTRRTLELARAHRLARLRVADVAIDLPAARPLPPRARALSPDELPDGPLLRLTGRLARAAGMRAWLVGGPVRDLLLGSTGTDLDVVVEGSAGALAGELALRLDGVVTRHRAFGTATVRLPDRRIDLATARRERYPRPGALPRVSRAGLVEDLARRDFGLNAIALSLDPRSFGRLVDEHGGRDDLACRRIRALHGLSFLEDPTRAFRAVRFAARLGFRLGPRTARLIEVAVRMDAFRLLSAARLRREIARLLEEAAAPEAARLAARLELWHAVDPALCVDAAALRRLRLLRRLAERARRACPWELQLATLSGPRSDAVRRRIVERLRPTRGQSRTLREAPLAAARLSARLPRDPGGRLSAVHAAVAGESPEATLLAAVAAHPSTATLLVRYLRRTATMRPGIGGKELLDAGMPASPRIARGLSAAYAAQLDRPSLSRGELLRIALRAARRA